MTPVVDPRAQHADWLSLVDVDGPFLTLPVLLRAWPTLEAVEPELMTRLRDAHARADHDTNAWLRFVVEDLLDLAGLVTWGPDGLAWREPQHDIEVSPTLVVRAGAVPDSRTGSETDAEVLMLGYLLPPGQAPTARVVDDDWAATWTDRAAEASRALGVELALVTDSRRFSLVWSPRGGATTTATFDSQTWPETADRVVVRAFRSLLGRRRFVGVPEAERLPALLRTSLDQQEEVTHTLGVQVRRAVEQLVDAFGRYDVREMSEGRRGLGDIDAHEVYAGAVSVMMRIVFLLFAEERGLLPADNPVYAEGYGASTLCEQLERAAGESGEEALEHSSAAWLQLLATAHAVYAGVSSTRLRLPAYDGSLFNPGNHAWLNDVRIDDRTVLHVMRAVQYVEIKKERRRVSFRTIGVEEIGYAYEGLLAHDAFRADQIIVGLAGKAGHEAEAPLVDLEAVAAEHNNPDTGELDIDSLADAVAMRYKDSGIGSATQVARRLQRPGEAERARRLHRLVAVCDGSLSLAERLLPFAGLLRDDLRGLPTVVAAGALYVTSSDARSKTGTHYTPSWLAREVTEEALKPLVHASPGPLGTDDESTWVPATAEQILALKVADIAMGSGAFLVSACRYLADRLVEAWARDGQHDAASHVGSRADTGDDALRVDAAIDHVVVDARRQVVQHCLYGVDINPMAVEMAKLSLWLVSMDPGRPFTFLDDRLVAGDSLLGAATLDQVEALHMLPARGRAIHRKWVKDPTASVRGLVNDLAGVRRKIADMAGESLADLDAKRARLADVELLGQRMMLVADLTAGAALAGAKKSLKLMDELSEMAGTRAEDADGRSRDAPEVERGRKQAIEWLTTDLPPGTEARQPFHWPLAFPEVAESGGFDAIIGNPPFLGGQKLTGAMGRAYREYLVHALGRSARGSADLVAFFALRAHELLSEQGQTGLIATNTLAQGDTREVGLDQLAADGVTIRRAVKSKPWPSKSAVLQYCAVWTSRSAVADQVPRVLDGNPVRSITPSLDPLTRVSGNPHRLAANAGIAFQGSIVLGLGFTMEPDEAEALIGKDARNAEVLFPYLNGQDLNSRPDGSASRWVINFHNWDEERARTYGDCFDLVERLVKPDRQRRKPDGTYTLRRPLPQRYWHYAEKRPAMTEAIAGLERVIVITRHSKVVMPMLAPTGRVFSEATAVFASDDPAMLGLLSSSPHYWWTIERASTLETRIRYTPTDVFETLARPQLTEELRGLGDRLDQERGELMMARDAGLTAMYNLVHDPTCRDADIVGLRELHREIDEAVFAAYGWRDLVAGHDHYETRQGVRWTVDPVARQDILDRLLELNHARHAEEQGRLPADEAPEGLF